MRTAAQVFYLACYGLLAGAARVAQRRSVVDEGEGEIVGGGRAFEQGHRLVEEALRVFLETRETPGLRKKPSTSELLDWLKLLVSEDVSPETLRERDGRKLIPPLHGALLKNEQDVSLVEKLAFMMRREGRGG